MTIYLEQETLQTEFIYQIDLKRLLNLANKGGIMMMKELKEIRSFIEKGKNFQFISVI